jgi:hypothetical protein
VIKKELNTKFAFPYKRYIANRTGSLWKRIMLEMPTAVQPTPPPIDPIPHLSMARGLRSCKGGNVRSDDLIRVKKERVATTAAAIIMGILKLITDRFPELA